MLQFHASNFVQINLQCQFLLPFIAWQVFPLDPSCKPFLHLLPLFHLLWTVNNDRCFYSADAHWLMAAVRSNKGTAEMDRFLRGVWLVDLTPTLSLSLSSPMWTYEKRKAFTFFTIFYTIVLFEDFLCALSPGFFIPFLCETHLTLLQTKQKKALKCRRAFYTDPAHLSVSADSDLCSCGHSGVGSLN